MVAGSANSPSLKIFFRCISTVSGGGIEQLAHLRLTQPLRVVLQGDLQLRLTVGRGKDLNLLTCSWQVTSPTHRSKHERRLDDMAELYLNDVS